MKFFSEKSLDFLRRIRENNTKEWFENHRHEYENDILEPSRHFVVEMGEHLQALVPTIHAIPQINGSLYRIFRDVRLSKNKTPMKSRIGIIFWQGRGSRMQSASFYLHFSPDVLLFAAGIRGFSKETLAGYRAYIKDEKKAQALSEILRAVQEKGYVLPEPIFKRYPRGFDKSMAYAHLSLYGNMYAFMTLPPAVICEENLQERAFKIYEDLLPLQQWVYAMTLSFEVKDTNTKSAYLSL